MEGTVNDASRDPRAARGTASGLLEEDDTGAGADAGLAGEETGIGAFLLVGSTGETATLDGLLGTMGLAADLGSGLGSGLAAVWTGVLANVLADVLAGAAALGAAAGFKAVFAAGLAAGFATDLAACLAAGAAALAPAGLAALAELLAVFDAAAWGATTALAGAGFVLEVALPTVLVAAFAGDVDITFVSRDLPLSAAGFFAALACGFAFAPPESGFSATASRVLTGLLLPIPKPIICKIETIMSLPAP